MRIINLEFFAFGPYPGKVEIDFVPINERQLFLITGPTGSGKTTIFDAIAFALFSQPSGNYRDRMGHRSHLCKTDEKTYVKLAFELNDNRYQIIRFPQQEIMDRNGKLVTKYSEAYLTLPDGTIIEGVRRVDEELSSILKLNASQFKRIVMLAQGEFRELLFASSQEREEIFRVIFGTDDLKRFTDILNEELKKVQKEKERICQKIDLTVDGLNLNEPKGHLPFEAIATMEGNDPLLNHLEKEIEQTNNQVEDLDKNIFEINDLITKTNVEKEKAREDNKDLAELKDYRNELSRLNQMESEIKNDEILIKKLDNIPYIETFENAYKSQLEVIQKLGQDYEKNQKEIETNENSLNKKEKEKLEIIEELNCIKKEWEEKNLSTHEKNINQYFEYDQNLQEFEKSKKDLKELVENYEEKNKEKLDKEKLLDAKEEKKQEYLKDINQKITILEEKVRCEKLIDKLNEFLKSIQSLTKKEQEIKALDKAVIIEEIKYHELNRDLAEMELKYSLYQAGALAADLKPGEPCPVCGSTEHPQLAIISEEVSKEKIEIQKEIAKKQSEKYNEIKAKLNTEKLNKESLNQKISDEKAKLDLDIEGEEAVAELINQTNINLNSLTEKYNNILEKEKELKIIEENIKDLQKDIETIKDELQTINNNKISKKTTLDNLLTRIEKVRGVLPKYYVNATILKELIENLNSNKIIKEQRMQDLNEETTGLKATIKQGKISLAKDRENLQNQKEELTKKENKLKEEILKIFDSAEEYETAKKNKDSKEDLVKKVDEYYKNIRKITSDIETLEKRTKGKEVVDLKVFDEKIEVYSKNLEEVNKKRDELWVKLNNNREGLKNLKKLYKDFLKINNHFVMINNLDDLARGQNEYRISFERYILASYFDNILKSANIKLKEMTGMRYQFEKREGKAKGRAQQGLDINIFDNYTGRERDVKTLSGGELFKASLALALGLSDVIQQNAGGISINTIFIDEGFGSLDSESLDSALQTLTDIQSKGKIIGIISHVQEVKDRLSTKIMIGTSKSGSYIDKITI